MNERREATRKRVYIGGRIVHRCILSDTVCLLRSLSASGARVIVCSTIPLPDRFDIAIDCRGTTQPVEAIWRAGDEIGVRFLTDAPARDAVAALQDRLKESRTEAAQLRTRIAEIERDVRPVDGVLH